MLSFASSGARRPRNRVDRRCRSDGPLAKRSFGASLLSSGLSKAHSLLPAGACVTSRRRIFRDDPVEARDEAAARRALRCDEANSPMSELLAPKRESAHPGTNASAAGITSTSDGFARSAVGSLISPSRKAAADEIQIHVAILRRATMSAIKVKGQSMRPTRVRAWCLLDACSASDQAWRTRRPPLRMSRRSRCNILLRSGVR
jgi:hypothetical protein